MDLITGLIERKESLVKMYNENVESIQRLTNMNQQILGQLQLIEEVERKKQAEEEEKKKEEVKEGENK